MSIITDVAKIGDRKKIGDDDLIGIDVWAALQGVAVSTFNAELSRTRRRRRHDEEHPDEPKQAGRSGRDIPEPDDYAGRTPLWRMSTYREWEQKRPGKNSSIGKAGGPGSRGGKRERTQVQLPVTCPHCDHEITAEDLGLSRAVAVEAVEAVPGAVRGGRRRRAVGA